MKKILLVSSLALATMFTHAQKRSTDNKVTFNVGGELAFASGNLNVTHSLGLGATAQLNYKLEENIDILVNGGIMSFSGRTIGGTSTKVKGFALIPISIGGNYFFSDNFYGHLALGVGLFSGGTGSATKFTYSPGVGFKINDKIDVLGKYTGFSNFGGAFGVRVGYTL
jgi:hypothetical protein